MSTPNEAYIKKLEKHIDSTRENKKYSIDRFDILIISLSSGALGLSISYLKDILKDLHCVNLTSLKMSWILFALAIICNLLSQRTAFVANEKEILRSV